MCTQIGLLNLLMKPFQSLQRPRTAFAMSRGWPPGRDMTFALGQARALKQPIKIYQTKTCPTRRRVHSTGHTNEYESAPGISFADPYLEKCAVWGLDLAGYYDVSNLMHQPPGETNRIIAWMFLMFPSSDAPCY